MFYTKTIEILNEVNGYVDDLGIWQEGQSEVIKTIEADVQPYSSERLYKDYGYRVKCTNRIFCDVYDEIKEGIIIKYSDQYFTVTKIIKWDDYMEVMVTNFE